MLMAQSSAVLKYNLEKDKVYRTKTYTVQDQKMTMQGMDRNTETKSITYFSLKMLDAKSEFFIAEIKFDHWTYSSFTAATHAAVHFSGLRKGVSFGLSADGATGSIATSIT